MIIIDFYLCYNDLAMTVYNEHPVQLINVNNCPSISFFENSNFLSYKDINKPPAIVINIDNILIKVIFSYFIINDIIRVITGVDNCQAQNNMGFINLIAIILVD